MSLNREEWIDVADSEAGSLSLNNERRINVADWEARTPKLQDVDKCCRLDGS